MEESENGSLAKRMGKLGILILRKIVKMAASTESIVTKIVESLNAELSEKRKKYNEAISKRNDFERRKTNAEGNERNYRNKVTQFRDKFYEQAGLNFMSN